MKKFEAPKLNVIKLEATDIIQTSGETGGETGGLTAGGNATIPGTGVVVPIPGMTSKTSIDTNY